MTKTPVSDTVKELPGYPVPTELSIWELLLRGAVGRVEIVYGIV
jgi:hypothetical protein